MDTFTASQKILDNLKAKYRHIDRIMNLTKDMETALLAGDPQTFGTILDMRGDVMILCDKLDQENREMISHFPKGLGDKMTAIIFPRKGQNAATLSLDNPLETNIYDTSNRINQLLTRVIKLDTELNRKVNSMAGRKQGLGDLRG